MDNVGIVVESLDAAISFFAELGLELSRFLAPPVVADHRNAPVNALGYLRVMFAVDDLDDTLARLRRHGAQLVDEVVQYENVYRLCYVRGPEDILIGLAEQIGSRPTRASRVIRAGESRRPQRHGAHSIRTTPQASYRGSANPGFQTLLLRECAESSKARRGNK